MATVRISDGVSIIFVDIQVPGQPFLAEFHLRAVQKALEDALTCLVIGDNIVWAGALRGSVFGMRARIEIKAGAIFEESVKMALNCGQFFEQITNRLFSRR